MCVCGAYAIIGPAFAARLGGLALCTVLQAELYCWDHGFLILTSSLVSLPHWLRVVKTESVWQVV